MSSEGRLLSTEFCTISKKSRLVVYRRDFAVRHMGFTRTAFRTHSALAEGQSLGASLEEAHKQCLLTEGEISSWFQQWFSEKLFQKAALAWPAAAKR